MKTIFYKDNENKQLVRLSALREWFILKICSVLQIGPSLKKYFGFDLIFYSNCVDFGMEECI
jgi:hypothetical protein